MLFGLFDFFKEWMTCNPPLKKNPKKTSCTSLALYTHASEICFFVAQCTRALSVWPRCLAFFMGFLIKKWILIKIHYKKMFNIIFKLLFNLAMILKQYYKFL